MTIDGKPNKQDLIRYFFSPEDHMSRSITGLDKNLTEVLALPLNPKELALVLYHSADRVVRLEQYGSVHASKKVIENHIQAWTDKALKAKPGPAIGGDPRSRGIYNGYTIAHIMDTFSILRLRPPERLAAFLEEKATKVVKEEFNATDAVFLVNAMANLGYSFGKEFQTGFKTKMQSIKTSISEDDVAGFLKSLATIDAIDEFTYGKSRRIYGQIYADMVNDKIVLAKIASVNTQQTRTMIADAHLWFTGKKIGPNSFRKDGELIFEDQVRAAFHLAGADIILPTHKAEPFGHAHDLTAAFESMLVSVECDRPEKFVRSVDDHTVHLDGSYILETMLMRRADPDKFLLRLPYEVFYSDPDRQTTMLESVLLNVIDTQPGAYLVNRDGGLLPLTGGYNLSVAFEDDAPSP